MTRLAWDPRIFVLGLGTKNLFAAPGLGVDPLPSRYSSPSEESEEAENNQTQQNDPVETPDSGNSPPLLESNDESEQP